MSVFCLLISCFFSSLFFISLNYTSTASSFDIFHKNCISLILFVDNETGESGILTHSPNILVHSPLQLLTENSNKIPGSNSRKRNSKLFENVPKANYDDDRKSSFSTPKKLDKSIYNSLVLESSSLKNRPDSSSQKFDGRISGRENPRGDVEVGSMDETAVAPR